MRQPRLATTLVVGLVLLPVVVSLAALIGRNWYPAGDYALELLQIEEVGGGNTPLTGAYSRWGWDHPGPLLFWLLAPFTWLFGATGALVGTAVLNGASLAGALLVARRGGGLALLVLTALVTVVLCTALGPGFLVDPWNPWVAVLPFFAFALLAWVVSTGDLAMAPWMVVAGTFVVQAHVGFAVLVLGLGVIGALLGWCDDDEAGRRVRPALIAVGVGALLWAPPLLQQLFGDDGNLANLLAYSRDPTGPTVGWARAWGVLGTELGLPGAWLAGGDDDPFGVPTSSTWPSLVLLAVTGSLGWLVARRGHRRAGRLALVALVASGLAVASTARVTGVVYHYVVRWWWVVAALVWLSLLWSVWLLARAGARSAALAVVLAATAVLAVVLGWRATPADVPEEALSAAIADLGPPVAAGLDADRAYLVEWVDGGGFGWAGMGMLHELRQRGHEAYVPATAQPAFEPWQVARPEDVDGTVLVVTDNAPVPGFAVPAGATVLARHDPSSADAPTYTVYLIGS
ncbi:hypothetical protein BH18ACT2_BH18ACT2_10000 [soil metagenome]